MDRFDRRRALLVCYAGFVLGTLACALAPTYSALLGARILSGAFGGVSGAALMTIVGDVVAPERRGRGMAIIMSAFSVASVAGVPTGLWMAAMSSWHAPFFFIAAMGLMIWFGAFSLFPSLRGHLEPDAQRKSPLRSMGELLANRNALIALLYIVTVIFGHLTIIPFIAPSMIGNVGLTEHQIPLIYLVGGACSILTAPLIGRAADRHGKFLVFTLLVCVAVIPLFLITNMPRIPLWQVLVVAGIFFTFAGGRFIPSQAISSSAVPARLRGSFMSLNSCVRDLAAGGASLLGGWIVVKEAGTEKLLHYPTLGWITIGASVLSVVVGKMVKAVA